MSELQRIKTHVYDIVEGNLREYTVVEHEHLQDDIWSITVESKPTGKLYTFKNDGFEFFEFEEKKSK